MWENSINIHEVREIRSAGRIYFGVGAIDKINEVAQELKKKEIDKLLVVTGKNSYKKSGAWSPTEKALNENGIEYKIYDGITPNPTTHQVDEATQIGLEFGARAVLAIGGGSSIDAGKSIAILLKNTEVKARDLFEFRFAPTKAAPIIAVNLTHGTGTEADRFAVVSIPETETKPSIGFDCIYPMISIDDPAMAVKLPKNQTLYVTIDAMNHAIESCSNNVSSPLAMLLSKEAVRLIAKYLPVALEAPEDLTARYYLMYAAMIAGISFDSTRLHFTHALEHPLSGVKPELAHGLGLAILLPSVIKKVYASRSEILAEILEPIIPGLSGNPDESEKAAIGMEKWLFGLGVTSKLSDEGFKEEDIEILTKQVFETASLAALLKLAPVPSDENTVREIYRESFIPLSVVNKP